MKKVVYVSNTNLARKTASVTQILSMCDAISDCGFEVTLIARANKKIDICALQKEYAIKHDFKILTFHVVSTEGEDKKSEGKFSKASFIAWALHKIIMINPFCVYTRHIMLASILSVFRKKLVYEAHQMYQSRMEPGMLRIILGQRTKSVVVTITNSLKSDILCVTGGEGSDRITIEPDGLPEWFFDTIGSSASKYDSTAPIVYMGSLYEGKGIQLILQLANLITYDIHVYGGSENEVESLNRYAQDNGLDHIQFMGRVDYRAVPDILCGASMLLLPNQQEVKIGGSLDIGKWTSPLKLFEYMASARPILVSDLPVLKEIVSDENAILCPSSSADVWAKNIEMVKKDSSSCLIKAKKARGDVKRYTWNERVKRVFKCVESMNY